MAPLGQQISRLSVDPGGVDHGTHAASHAATPLLPSLHDSGDVFTHSRHRLRGVNARKTRRGLSHALGIAISHRCKKCGRLCFKFIGHTGRCQSFGGNLGVQIKPHRQIRLPQAALWQRLNHLL